MGTTCGSHNNFVKNIENRNFLYIKVKMGMWQEILLPVGIMIGIYTGGTAALYATGRAIHGTPYTRRLFDTTDQSLYKRDKIHSHKSMFMRDGYGDAYKSYGLEAYDEVKN